MNKAKPYSAICIIYNPNSTGPSEAMANQFKAKLSKYYPDITLYPTKYAGHAEKLAYKFALSTKHPLIISASGDGGYNEVINGAMQAQTRGAKPICAVLPAGNANDHRRTTKKSPLLDAIKQNRIEKMDLLKVTIRENRSSRSRFAHSYIGLGFTPVIAVELNKQTLNAINELWIVLKTFYKYRPFKVSLGDKIQTLDSILFTNIGQMAKVLTVSKTAKIDDGKFEVVIFPHKHKLKLTAKLFRAALPGLNPQKKYSSYKLTVLKKMPMQLDGEVEIVKKGAKINVEARKQALRTLR